ncbi:MAG TPA: hypothetical protein VFI13_03060 [Gemmatimonadales bacterium]|nr:hypothetical protein [Gemmatimonadales bacterium]
MRTTLNATLAVALLVGTAACTKHDPNEAIGNLQVITHLNSGTPDPDGYTVGVNGHGTQPIGVADSVFFGGLPFGDYTVSLTGVAVGCTVTDGASQTIYVPVGTRSFDFYVTCP